MVMPTPQPCLSFAVPPLTLPSIFAPTFGANLTFPPPPVLPSLPCCTFTIPAASIPISLPPLPIGTLLVTINGLITAGLAILFQVSLPKCNF